MSQSDLIHLLEIYLSILHAAGDHCPVRCLAIFLEEAQTARCAAQIGDLVRKWRVLEIHGMRIIG